MITRELSVKVTALLAAVDRSGLHPLVAENHAYQTLKRILDTGTSIPDGIKEPDEDTKACAACFVKPQLWGIFDPLWLEFVDTRMEI
jgi:hypothetical protein